MSIAQRFRCSGNSKDLRLCRIFECRIFESNVLIVFALRYNCSSILVIDGGKMNLIDRVKNWEYPRLEQLVYKVITEIVSLVIAVLFFVDRISNSQKPLIYILIAAVIVIGLILLIILSFLSIIDSHRELDRRADFIKEIAKKYNPTCEIVSRKDEYIVKANGNGVFVRTMCLATDPTSMDSVFWYEIGMGTTRNHTSRTYNSDIQVINPITSRALSKIWFERSANLHRYAILLNPVIDNTTHQTDFRVSRKWRGVWHDLVKKNEDDGRIRVPQPVKEFCYSIELPNRYCVDSFSFDSDNQLWNVKKELTPNNRHKITITRNNVPVGVYHYNISVGKKKW